MKIKLFFLVLLFTFGAHAQLFAVTNDSNEILSLVKKVYEQDTRAFLRIEMKESTAVSIKYYKQFFTPETTKILVRNLSEISAIGPFDAEDPRYNEGLNNDPGDADWYKYLSRTVLNLRFHTPVISKDQAILEVDTRIKGHNQEYRSEYHLVKTKNGWRISNIKWGPKGNFEEKTTQGIRFIF